MARDESLPFARGETYYNGGTIDATDDTTLGGVNLEGQTFRVLDTIRNTGEYVTLRVVRNVSTGNLKPKELVKFDTTTPYLGKRVKQRTVVDADYCFPVDELLPAAGVVPNDLFYIVERGPALVLTPATPTGVINVGDFLVSLTAATSGAADAGHATTQSILASTTANIANANQIQNAFGRAMSACTTGNTNTALLCGIRW